MLKLDNHDSRIRYIDLLLERVNAADLQLNNRRTRPFSREELAVLFAAMLMEP